MIAELVQDGSVDVAPGSVTAYLPIEWQFGGKMEDGIGNAAPKDDGTIYIGIGDSSEDENPTYLSVTLASLVEYALDGWCGRDGASDAMHHSSSDRLAAEFRRLANLLDSRKIVGAKTAALSEK